MTDTIQDLQANIDRQLGRPDADHTPSQRTRQWATWRLEQLTPRLKRVTRPDAYHAFLVGYLEAEAEKFTLTRQADGDDANDILDGTPYESLRDTAVCTCNGRFAHRCELKQGRLPREIDTASDIDTGIERFRHGHGGRPIALLEAREAYWELVADVERQLRTILMHLSMDSIPRETDWPDATDDASKTTPPQSTTATTE